MSEAAITDLAAYEAIKARHTLPSDGIADAPANIKATPYVWVRPESLPRRQFIYGRHLIRGFVSADIAPGGLGKSSVVTAEALAMRTGRALLGEQPAGRLRVWLVNLEDPIQELRRRIAATALHYNIGSEDIGDGLFVDSGRDTEMVIAIDRRDGIEIAVPVVEAIRSEIARKSLDVMMVDPFVACHAVPENDNGKIAAVVRQWANIAEATGCAINLVHHARKAGAGQAVTVEDARGASALVNAARSVRVLNPMTKDEAERAGVDNHRSYFSVTNGKSNLAPPSEKAVWRRFISVPLGNGTDDDPEGDRVGVIEQWTWPDPFRDVGADDAKEVQRRIANGEFRADHRSTQWAGKVVAEVLDFDLSDRAASAAVRNLLKTWVSTGALRVVTRKDGKRMDKQFVEVGQWLP
jgi:hypothetical protein